MVSRLHLRLLAGFWTTAAVITLLGTWAIQNLSLVRPLYSGPFHPIPLFRMWTRFDCSWYQQIVTNGYRYDPKAQSSIVFWPTYPMTLRPLYLLGMNPYVAGSLVTVVAASVAIVVFMAWQRDYRYPAGIEPPTTRVVVLSVLLWLAYPYAFFLYGSNYSDALFVAVCLTAFWLVEKDRPLLAGIVGIAATAGRPFGWALTVALAVRILERRWEEREGEALPLRTLVTRPMAVVRTIRPFDLTIGLSGLGVLGYLGYLWIRFGSPFVFATNESQWGQGSGPKVIFKGLLVHDLINMGRTVSPVTGLNLLFQGIIGVTLVTWGARAMLRRFGIGVTLFVVITLVPAILFTRDFRGIGRYCISVFPAFAMLGHLLAPRGRAAVAVVAGSGAMMVLLSVLFARGYYLT